MKSIFIFLVLIATTMTAISGITGVGGGSNIDQFIFENEGHHYGQKIQVQTCDGGESGMVCKNIVYFKKPDSPILFVKENCTAGESGFIVPCNKNAHTPNWLKKLNSVFDDSNISNTPQPPSQN